MIGLTSRVFLRIHTVAFGRKNHTGKAYILYYSVDARTIILARSAKAEQELRNGQCHMDLLHRYHIF